MLYPVYGPSIEVAVRRGEVFLIAGDTCVVHSAWDGYIWLCIIESIRRALFSWLVSPRGELVTRITHRDQRLAFGS